jgi:hypothetical protein
MALEDLTGSDKFITSLVPANPAGGDDRREGDNHIRGIKNVLLNTFPNVDSQIYLSDEQFNALANAIIAQTDAHLKTLLIGTDFANPALFYQQEAGSLHVRYGPSSAYRYASFDDGGDVIISNGGVNSAGDLYSSSAVRAVLAVKAGENNAGGHFVQLEVGGDGTNPQVGWFRNNSAWWRAYVDNNGQLTFFDGAVKLRLNPGGEVRAIQFTATATP